MAALRPPVWPLASVSGMLSALHGKPLDLLYAMLVHRLSPNGIFFTKGWGDVDKVDWLQGAEALDWPPPELKASWTVVRKGKSHGVKYSIMEGKFRSPVSATTWDALPKESRAGRVQLLVPEAPMDSLACVIHLPGTGDQGFNRRLRLGFPLLPHGIASLVLESPFYGARRPGAQVGSKLRYVSDLLALGRATIEESMSLLYWANLKGFGPLGVCGLSMGGVHSCMVASLYPGPVACSPMLTPRSAAVAFCQGALQQAWEPLALTSAAIEPTGELTNDPCLSSGPIPQRGSPLSSVGPMTRLDSSLWDQLAMGPPAHEAPELPFYPEDFESEAGVLWRWYLLESKAQAQKQLQQVLERYTDVKKFPRPKRPDAAVFVAARDDAYVSPDSVLELHRYWEGSEMRWVPGGHVSSFLFQTGAFCGAIKDSVKRLGRKGKEIKTGSQMASPLGRVVETQLM